MQTLAQLLVRVAQRGVRSHAAAEAERARARLLERHFGLLHLHVHHRLLETGADVRHVQLAAGGAFVVDIGDHRGFQTRQREAQVARVHHGTRERDGVRVALGRLARDDGTARIAQAQRLRHLVERLAHRVVDGSAQRFVVAPALHMHEQRVAARHERHHRGRLEIGRADLVRVQVAFQMVHAHHERTHEPRRVRHGNGIQIAPGQTFDAQRGSSHVEALVAHAADSLDVLAASDLGHHAAEARMEVDLRGHDVGDKRAVAVDDGGRRLVAGRFDGEDEGAAFGCFA